MSDGVFGIMANVLATYVILFVLFGAFLEKSGAQKFFIDWPLAAVGHKIGGPGQGVGHRLGSVRLHLRQRPSPTRSPRERSPSP
jgi:hypothetical protein